MTADQAILFALFAAVLALFLWGRLRYDLVAFGALVAGVLLGVVPAQSAFAGFGHPATVLVALVLIASAGLGRAGVVQLLMRLLASGRRGPGGHVAVMGGAGALLSAVMNNVAALALLMPADLAASARARRAAALTLMPVSFATILGGMLTLIGTPPNIIVASFREGAAGAPFGMFDFLPVGAAVAAAGLAFLALAGWRLIPARPEAPDPRAEVAAYVAELLVPEGSRAAGRRLADLDAAAEAADAAVIGVQRDGRRLARALRGVELREGDMLLVEAAPDALEAFRAEAGLAFPQAGGAGERPEPGGGGRVLVEMVATSRSRITGRTAQAIGLHWRQGAVLMGIVRRGRTLRERVRMTRVAAGDTLLVLTPEETAADVAEWLGALPLAGRSVAVTRQDRTAFALAVFAAAVAAASLGVMPMAVALGAVVILYVLGGVLTAEEVYGSVDWPVVVLLGAMIPLGLALDDVGGTALIAAGLAALTAGLPAWISLAVLMVAVMFLSDVLNNNATAILAAPVALRLAETLGASPDPFLMAVAVGASCAFLTPIGHQNNTLILGPGGYRFGDYWPVGLPLEAIVVAVGLPAILLVWPL